MEGWQIDRAPSGLLYSSPMCPWGRCLGGAWQPLTYEQGIKVLLRGRLFSQKGV